MRVPMKIRAVDITEGAQTQTPSGRWVPSRPMPYFGFGLLERLRIAWLVFTGRCDAVDWDLD